MVYLTDDEAALTQLVFVECLKVINELRRENERLRDQRAVPGNQLVVIDLRGELNG